MPSRPNILFVLVDLRGARWLAFNGSREVQRPKLEEFASENSAFERAIMSESESQ